jgi:hypothetical protein
MAFVRRRITKTGQISTALVESYRGSSGGKPRHRLIANLHGAETLAAALGRLAALRDRLRKKRDQLDLAAANEFYASFTQQTMAGRVWTVDERKDIDRLLKARKRLLKRVAEIDAQLEQVQREGVAIKKHCKPTADEIRAEVAKHAKQLDDAEAHELAVKIMGSKRGRAMLNKLANG